jgi:zinc finger SWIM domain-containing protein 3
MIFVPFTGVDHHKRCVLFGAGLLYDETIESYTWLLQMFLKAHKKQPSLVLTDQDASMKQAVSNVFTESTHRLCMWHITEKLPSKVTILLTSTCSISIIL